MPKKPAKKTLSKNLKSTKKTESFWTKKFFEAEQIHFQKTHPTLNLLIGLFLGTISLVSVVFIYSNLEALAVWLT